MNGCKSDLLRQFENHTIDPDAFHHREHLEVAFLILRKYPFLEALEIYSDSIRAIAEKAGAPGKYNLTITLVFLSLIAERSSGARYSSFEEFLQDNPDLDSPRVLDRSYSSERLSSELARQVFLLPDCPGR